MFSVQSHHYRHHRSNSDRRSFCLSHLSTFFFPPFVQLRSMPPFIGVSVVPQGYHHDAFYIVTTYRLLHVFDARA